MNNLIEAYLKIMSPSHLLKNKEEVRAFLTNASPEEIQGFIEACVTEESYEYAAVAKTMLDEWKAKNLSLVENKH